jgi:predicted GNAT superfamily acetyltransferase
MRSGSVSWYNLPMQTQHNESGFVSIDEASINRALDLNNRHATELSFQTLEEFRQLVARATYAKWCPGERGFLIAFDECAAYRNSNFAWFRARYPAFTYIDRVVIDPVHRGQGLARRLYENLFAQSRAAGRSLIVCEVNAEPPNPASDAFHARLGFSPVGSAALPDQGKTVRYFTLDLSSPVER